MKTIAQWIREAVRAAGRGDDRRAARCLHRAEVVRRSTPPPPALVVRLAEEDRLAELTRLMFAAWRSDQERARRARAVARHFGALAAEMGLEVDEPKH